MSEAGSSSSDPAAEPPSESPAESSESSSEASADAPDGADSPADDARRRFREALDRKKFGHRGGGGGTAGPQARAPHTSPAKPQRSFRRKSG